MNTPATSDKSLDSLAIEINTAHAAACHAAHEAVGHARHCGELLVQAKAALRHGHFLAWIAANCQVGQRQARNYIVLAKNWGRIAKSAPGSDLSIKQALRLIHEVDHASKFAMPTLTTTTTLVGLGTGSLAVVEPMHDRYFYVGVFHDLDGDRPYIIETRRGIIDYAVPFALKRAGFIPIAKWSIDPFEPRPEANNLGIWAVAARQYWHAEMRKAYSEASK
jgi:hypothetical protein